MNGEIFNTSYGGNRDIFVVTMATIEPDPILILFESILEFIEFMILFTGVIVIIGVVAPKVCPIHQNSRLQ